MVRISYTRHALERLAHRHVSKEQVEEAITAPDNKVESHGDRVVVTKTLAKAELRVVYKSSGDEFLVITVYWIGDRR